MDDSFAHGASRYKAIAYASVKDVIEKGVIIDSDYNHKERGYNSYVVAAPIKIGSENYICEVVLKQNKKETRFYLHEVTEQKKFRERVFVTSLPQKATLSGTLYKLLENTFSVNDVITCPLSKKMEPEKAFVKKELENRRKSFNRQAQSPSFEKRNLALEQAYTQGEKTMEKNDERTLTDPWNRTFTAPNYWTYEDIEQ